MKRIICLLLILAMTFSLLVACGDDDKPAESKPADQGGTQSAAETVSEAASTLAANGWAPQIALDSIKPAADGVLTVAMQQPSSVNWVISFAFVGLEVFTGIALVVILFFLNVEKDLPRKQAEIKARRDANTVEGDNE